MCDHVGTSSGTLSLRVGQLVQYLRCDQCGQIVKQLPDTVAYRPDPKR